MKFVSNRAAVDPNRFGMRPALLVPFRHRSRPQEAAFRGLRKAQDTTHPRLTSDTSSDSLQICVLDLTNLIRLVILCLPSSNQRGVLGCPSGN